MRPSLSIDVNDKKIRDFMKRFPDELEDAQRRGLEDAATLALHDLSTYPRQRTGSEYVRTMVLSKSWSKDEIRKVGLELRIQIGSNANAAPYNRLVQDEDEQADIHKVIWKDKTVQAVARDRAQDFADMYEKRIHDVVK